MTFPQKGCNLRIKSLLFLKSRKNSVRIKHSQSRLSLPCRAHSRTCSGARSANFCGRTAVYIGFGDAAASVGGIVQCAGGCLPFLILAMRAVSDQTSTAPPE